MQRPSITAVCLTRNRRAWLPRAIRAFEQQDYAGEKELLIVWAGEPVDDLVAGHADVRVVRAAETAPFGELRNIGHYYAEGDVILHWDDDDWSLAGRVSDQVGRLQMGAGVTGYHTLAFRELRRVRVPAASLYYDGRAPRLTWRDTSGWWLFRDPQGAAAGASLAYWRRPSYPRWELWPFRESGNGADDVFWADAVRTCVAAGTDGREFLCATNHTGCTSGRLIGGDGWEELPGNPYGESWVEGPMQAVCV